MPSRVYISGLITHFPLRSMTPIIFLFLITYNPGADFLLEPWLYG